MNKGVGVFDWRDLPSHPELSAIVARLAAGDEVNDRDFDRLLPKSVQKLSRLHWSPVSVARRAAELLAQVPGARILDVGSGAGKFCLIGALTTSGHFTGIEEHAPLVRLAKELSRRYGIAHAQFHTGDATAVDWAGYDGIYLYNPFAEEIHLTRHGLLSMGSQPDRYSRLIGGAQAQFDRLKSGARVALFYGFGGQRPAGFEVLLSEPQRAGTLEFWVKR